MAKKDRRSKRNQTSENNVVIVRNKKSAAAGFLVFLFVSGCVAIILTIFLVAEDFMVLKSPSPTSEFNKWYLTGLAIYFVGSTVLAVVIAIFKWFSEKREKRKMDDLQQKHLKELEEIKKQIEEANKEKKQNDNKVDNSTSVNNSPSLIINQQPQQPYPVPMQPQFIPMFVPFPVYMNNQTPQQMSISGADNAYYNPAVRLNEQVPSRNYNSIPQQSNYRPERNGYNLNNDRYYSYDNVDPNENQLEPPTIYPDEPQLNSPSGNWIRKYRDPSSPNIICYEYADRICYYRVDGNGNLSYVFESPR